jgi:hypothetical protein
MINSIYQIQNNIHEGDKKMIKTFIYNYYYSKFMKENSKNEKDIDWIKLSRLDKMCEKYYK